MSGGKLFFASGASALAMLVAAPSALAQETEVIIVTAQKREQALQDVSAAVSAVSADRLASAHISNIEDLQVIVPNIYFGNDFNMAKTFIRGVGANTSTTGSETGVALHVDGAFVARAEAQLTSLFDLERIEVLRGPQGTLYGRNAVGGSINFITAKPTEEFEAYGRVTVGNHRRIDGEGAVSGKITETLLGRVAFKSENRNGFGINPVTGNDVDDLKRTMARVHLNWVPSDVFDILFSGEYYSQNDASRALKFRRAAFPGLARLPNLGELTNPAPMLSGPAVAPRDLASEFDPATETETWSGTVTTNWQATENITLTNISNFREIIGFITQDLDLSATVNSFAATGSVARNSTIQRRDIKSRQFSTEQQFKWASEHFDAVVGFFYFNEKQDPVDTVDSGPVLGQPHLVAKLAAGPYVFNPTDVPFVPSLEYALFLCNSGKYLGDGTTLGVPPPKRVCIKTHLTNRSWAAFGQGNLNLGLFSDALDAFAIKFGARYSDEKVTAQSPSIIFAGQGVGPAPILLTTGAGNFNARTFDNFSPEGGIEFAPTEDLLFYYTYSRGFKAGAGENNQGPGATAPVPFRSIIVDPEIIVNHEAGLKSEWFDNRLLVNIAGFTYDLRGQQINKTLSGGPAGFGTIFENAAQTSAKGVELDFTALLTDRFRIGGSVNWLDSKYTDFLTIDPLVPQNVTTLPGVPPGTPAGVCPTLTDPPITWPTACLPFGGIADPNAGTIQLAGNPTRNSPKWSMAFHAEFDIPLNGFVGLDGMLTPMVDVTYKSDVFFTEFNRLLEGQPSYTLVDANLRFVSGNERITADLFVKNVSDKLVASSTFQLATARVIGVTYMPPRTYGFSLGYRF
jgi:iron complex outermembrane receptor protein